jgi:hypothetical protein
MAVEDVGELLAADAELLGRLRHAQAERLEAVMTHREAGMRRVLHRHRVPLVPQSQIRVTAVISVVSRGVTPALKRSEGPHAIHTSMPIAIAMRSFASLQRGDYPARDDSGLELKKSLHDSVFRKSRYQW